MSKFKKAVSLIVSGLLLMQTIGVQASALETQTIDYDSTAVGSKAKTYSNVEVEAERAEIYSVTLPKYVTLDITEDVGTFEYNVKVTGEISSNHFVRVIPLDGSTISDESGTIELPLAVVQTKRRWDYNEVIDGNAANTTSGTFTANDVAPGKYSGKVKYLVTLDDGAQWVSATCTTPETRVGVDSNDNGVIDTEELDSTTVTRGTALGHDLPSVRNLQCTCARCESTLFAISTPEHLIEFANNVSGGRTYYNTEIILTNDLDLTGYSVPPIGKPTLNSTSSFKGTFDGCNHVIYNYVSETDVTNAMIEDYGVSIGLFGSAVYATIKNLTLQAPVININIASSATSSYILYTAFLVANHVPDGVIENVHINKGKIAVTGGDSRCILNFGGLTSSISTQTKNTVKNCNVVAEMSILPDTCSRTELYGYSECSRLYNSYSAIKTIVNDPINYKDALNEGNTTVTNCFYDNTLLTSSVGTGLTTEECKSQTALDILNTDNDLEWSLDLEGINNGYPVIK